MNILREITLSDMVQEFIRAELASPRFRDKYLNWLHSHHMPESDITHLSPQQRQTMLWECRPGMCRTLPVDTKWYDVELTSKDWEKLLMINYEPWVSFSHGTRRVLDSLDRLNQPRHRVLNQRVREIQQEQNQANIPKIILLTNTDQSRLVIVEGHVRAITYAAAGRWDMLAIVGVSEHAGTWSWF